jgi:hypothetical protein
MTRKPSPETPEQRSAENARYEIRHAALLGQTPRY